MLFYVVRSYSNTFQPNVDSWFREMGKKLEKHSLPQANGCRAWLGGPTQGAYGQMSARMPLERSKKTQWVHRLAWLVANRSLTVPEGLEVSHRCHNGRCVEPTHLVAEDHSSNISRKDCKGKDCTKKHVPHCISQVILLKLSGVFLLFACS